MGSWKKRGDYSYRLTVSQGYDSDGKKLQRQKTIHLPEDLTEKQIEKELTLQLDKFEKEVQRGASIDGSITLKEFSEKWMTDYAEPSLRPKTVKRYKQLLQRIIKALGHKRLDSIQPIHLVEFNNNLSEGGIRLDYKYRLKPNIVSDIPGLKHKVSVAEMNIRTIDRIIQGKVTDKDIAEKLCKTLNMPLKKVFDVVDSDKKLSEKSISHHHKLISALLTTAVQWQIIESNPAERMKAPKVTQKEAQYYDIDEANQMLTLLDNEPIKYKTMISTVIFSGLRAGELAALEWSDISFEKKTIKVCKQLQYLPERGIYEVNSAKTDSGNRIIPIQSTLVDILRKYKAWQEEEKTKWGDKWVDSNKLFTQENGEPIYPYTPSKWFAQFVQKNNLPYITFHQLRHTYGSLLIAENVDVVTVSKLMGHSSPAVTLKIYAHLIDQRAVEAADKLENLFIKKGE